jgi:integrase
MARPKDRASAEGLLPNMEARPWANGRTITYRYKPLGSKTWKNLGTDKAKALQAVLDMSHKSPDDGKLRWVWAQYTSETNPAPNWARLTDGTKTDYRGAWKQIDAVLGNMHCSRITPHIVARYVHIERAGSPRRADVEKSLLSRLFGHAIKLGCCDSNPTKDVEPHGSDPKTEAPDDQVLAAFLGWVEQQTPQRRIVGMAAEYAALTGSRRVEFLHLTWEQLDLEAGVVATKRAKQRRSKRGRVTELVSMGPKLLALAERLKALRAQRDVDCAYVFPDRINNPYNVRSFKTLWGRCMTDAIEKGVITAEQRFTFHDLRAYYTTVHKKQRKTLPDLHTNPQTTAQVYDRNEEVERDSL